MSAAIDAIIAATSTAVAAAADMEAGAVTEGIAAAAAAAADAPATEGLQQRVLTALARRVHDDNLGESGV